MPARRAGNVRRKLVVEGGQRRKAAVAIRVGFPANLHGPRARNTQAGGVAFANPVFGGGEHAGLCFGISIDAAGERFLLANAVAQPDAVAKVAGSGRFG